MIHMLILYKQNDKNYTKIDQFMLFNSQIMIFLLCVLTIAISEGSQYYGVVFYSFGRPYYRLENAFYACLHRTLFVLAPLWFLVAYLTTGLGTYFTKFTVAKGIMI